MSGKRPVIQCLPVTPVPITRVLYSRASRTRFGNLRRRTVSWCRSTRTSASNAARDRNSLIKAHQINLQRSLIKGTIDRLAGVSQLSWVCGRDSGSPKTTTWSTHSASDRSDQSFSEAVLPRRA
jgi:hypothetical protein